MTTPVSSVETETAPVPAPASTAMTAVDPASVPRAPADEPPGWLDNPVLQRRLGWLGLGVLFAALLSNFVIDKHPHFGFDGIKGFYAAFGFAATIGLFLVMKLWGLLVRQPEAFYDNADPADRHARSQSGGSAP